MCRDLRWGWWDTCDVFRHVRAPTGRRLVGVEAVIDKDLASAMLAADLGADALLIVTDVDAVYAGLEDTPAASNSASDAQGDFAGERVRGWVHGAQSSSCLRVRRRDRRSRRDRVDYRHAALLRCEAGTSVTPGTEGLEFY